jgi:hypothetical protein
MVTLPQTISPQIYQGLVILYTRLKEISFPWAITGSLGMVLQGLQMDIHDIDLQSDQAGAQGIQDLLPEYITRPLALKETERLRSYLGALDVMGVQVEIIGDIQKRQMGGEWGSPPDLAKIIHHVSHDQMRLPVVDLEHEYEAYLYLGRTEKAQKIRHFLDHLKQAGGG